ncbi:S8 family peptidase [Roseiconus lacunae]|uniref:S8 family peptidase n=1 Tax=Roseiconus lacunae TaxID=2605694 RepID=UPI001E57CB93|nr:S8 family serine peptidase [Roseiconus lacunae]MCD0460693.1 S8 family serine peptidase [Roseiconus lacunae]
MNQLDHGASQPTNSTSAIYIHGIGSHPPAAVWKSQWDLALFGRPMREQTCGAYWADILHGGDERLSSQTESMGDWETSWILKQSGLNDDDQHATTFVERLSARLGLTVDDELESISTQATPAPRSWRGRIADAFLRLFVQDAAAYFFDPDVRRRIKKRLQREITRAEKPFVLVSHSMGTIIAYEVLSEMAHEEREQVSLLLTLGSPLGIREIQDQLVEDGLPLEVPSGIGCWHNFADRLDPVSLDSRLANDFPVPTSAYGPIQDHRIINRNLWGGGGINPHDSAGYLSHPEVREVVHQIMRFDSTGRFVIARDVAHGFAAREMRQPVLIEVLEAGYPAINETYVEMEEREKRQRKQSKKLKSLAGRIKHLAQQVEAVVEDYCEEPNPEAALKAARIQRLRKYVAAHLTPTEVQALAMDHADLNIYAMWRSAAKKKLIHRSHRAIAADAARSSFRSSGKGITWAVLDTGCRFDHPHFHRRKKSDRAGYANSVVIEVLDCTTASPEPVLIEDPLMSDPDGHGTHVCGIIAGRGKEGSLTHSGVAPKTKLLVYKVLDDHGFGEDASIIKAIDDIFRRNENNSGLAVHGVNLSLGGSFDPTVYGCGFSPLCKELRDLWRQGTLVCVAAGNDGQIQVATQEGQFDLNTSLSIGDPANLDDCIAVGSVNTDKPYLHGISHFSSRGPTMDGRIKPDVVAPGERISSCSNDFNGRLYRESSGTSMACPHVSGLLAAFLSVRREFIGRPDEVKKILLSNCNDVGRDRNHQGHGIPNLLKMLTET